MGFPAASAAKACCWETGRGRLSTMVSVAGWLRISPDGWISTPAIAGRANLLPEIDVIGVIVRTFR
jgi:hypothetical protein